MTGEEKLSYCVELIQKFFPYTALGKEELHWSQLYHYRMLGTPEDIIIQINDDRAFDLWTISIHSKHIVVLFTKSDLFALYDKACESADSLDPGNYLYECLNKENINQMLVRSLR